MGDGADEGSFQWLRAGGDRLGIWVARVLMAAAVLVPVGLVAHASSRVVVAWRSVERAVDSFDAPAGFAEVETVRQGQHFCLAICTSDHATLTLLMATSLSAPEACASLETAMNDLVVGAASIGDNRCAWSGEVHGSVYVVGTVASKALDFERYGPSGRLPYGWADVADTPDSELVVWVSFSAPMFQ